MRLLAVISVLLTSIQTGAWLMIDHPSSGLIRPRTVISQFQIRSSGGEPGTPTLADDESLSSDAKAPTTKISFGKGTADYKKANYLKKQRWQKSLRGSGPERQPSYMAETSSSFFKSKEVPPPQLGSPPPSSSLSSPHAGSRSGSMKSFVGEKPGYMKETASSFNKKAWAGSSGASGSSTFQGIGPVTPEPKPGSTVPWGLTSSKSASSTGSGRSKKAKRSVSEP